MSGHIPAPLVVTRHSFGILEMAAEGAGRSVERFIDESAVLGLNLAETVIAHAPVPVTIGFQSATGYDIYPVYFGLSEGIGLPVTSAAPLTATERALEASLGGGATDDEKEPLPLQPELLTRVGDMALLLCTSSSQFMERSIFFRWLWSVAVNTGKEIILSDVNNDYDVLDSAVFDNDEYDTD